jgi:hypothetical protein
MTDFEFLPEIPIDKSHTLEQVTARFQSVRDGLPELVKNAKDQYARLGIIEAESLISKAAGSRSSTRSPQLFYDAVQRYVFHRVFQDHLRDADEPRTWLGAAAFLGLNQYSAAILDERIRAAEEVVARASEWLNEEKQDSLRSGPVGGKRAITRSDLDKLSRFLVVLQKRFELQMSAIRKKAAVGNRR